MRKVSDAGILAGMLVLAPLSVYLLKFWTSSILIHGAMLVVWLGVAVALIGLRVMRSASSTPVSQSERWRRRVIFVLAVIVPRLVHPGDTAASEWSIAWGLLGLYLMDARRWPYAAFAVGFLALSLMPQRASLSVLGVMYVAAPLCLGIYEVYRSNKGGRLIGK